MLTSRYQNSEQNQNMKTSKRSFQNLAEVKYLGTIVTNKTEQNQNMKTSKRSFPNLAEVKYLGTIVTNKTDL
jgi:hypothetical protein